METNRTEKSNFTVVYGLEKKNYINLNKIRLSNGVSKIIHLCNKHKNRTNPRYNLILRGLLYFLHSVPYKHLNIHSYFIGTISI